jgi:hypothetical protein
LILKWSSDTNQLLKIHIDLNQENLKGKLN